MSVSPNLAPAIGDLVGNIFKSAFKSTSSANAIASRLSYVGGASVLQNIYYKNTVMTEDTFIDDDPFRDDTMGTVKVYGKVWLRADPSAVGLELDATDPSKILEVYRMPDANGTNGGLVDTVGDVLENIAINGITQGATSLANLIFRKNDNGNKTIIAQNGSVDPTTGLQLPTNLSDAQKAQNGYKIEDLLNVEAGAACCDSLLVRDCNGNWVAQTKAQFLEGIE